MRTLLTLSLALLCLNAMAEGPHIGIVSRTSVLNSNGKIIPLQRGDTLKVVKYLKDKDAWLADYKGSVGTIPDYFIWQSSEIQDFKETFLPTEAELYATWVKKYGVKIAKLMRAGSVCLGMPASAVTAVIGSPSDVNESVGKWGRHEQWVYNFEGKTEYYYFDNGKLSSWQD